MNWDEKASDAALRDEPTRDWEWQLVGPYAWGVAFYNGAQWQREQLRAPEAVEKASADKGLTGMAEDAGCDQEWIIETVLNALLGESE